MPERKPSMPEGTLCRGAPIIPEDDSSRNLIEGRVTFRPSDLGRMTWFIDNTPVNPRSVVVLQPGLGSGKELGYSFSGYGPGCWIGYDGHLLSYANHNWDKNQNPDSVVTDVQWSSFLKEVDGARVWNWKADYWSKHAGTDGPWWSVIIEGDGKRVVSQGYQAYPRTFERFRRALQLLIGDRPYN